MRSLFFDPGIVKGIDQAVRDGVRLMLAQLLRRLM